jgi:hypothetical protein
VALQGKAARVLADAHLEEGTFEEMVSAVSARFTPEEKVFRYMHDWNQLRQAENEDVDDYAHTFKSLWDKACPGEPLEVDGETKPTTLLKFICGLEDPKIAEDVLNKGYQNVEQVIKRVRLLQSTDKYIEKKYGDLAEVAYTSEVVEEEGGGTDIKLQSPQYDAPGVSQTQGEHGPDYLQRQRGQGHGQGQDSSLSQGQGWPKRCRKGIRKRKGRGQGQRKGHGPGESQGQRQGQEQSDPIDMAKVETQLTAMQAVLSSIEGQVVSQLAATLPKESDIESILHPLNCQGLTCWSVDQSQKTGSGMQWRKIKERVGSMIARELRRSRVVQRYWPIVILTWG